MLEFFVIIPSSCFQKMCKSFLNLRIVHKLKKAQSFINQSFKPFHTSETPGTRTRDNLIKSHSIHVLQSLMYKGFAPISATFLRHLILLYQLILAQIGSIGIQLFYISTLGIHPEVHIICITFYVCISCHQA